MDVLEEGGCVLRDPKGPRHLIMGLPHPRSAEGLWITFQFEPLGEKRAEAEWRFNLMRKGGGDSTLKFGADQLSLSTVSFDPAVPEELLAAVKLPRADGEPRVHTLGLIPGEGLHVYLDQAIVATFAKEDAILPSQPSLVVVHGKLQARSILVKKKPAK